MDLFFLKNAIVEADEAGIVVRVNATDEVIPWREVYSVTAGRTQQRNKISYLMIAIEIATEDGPRIFVMLETDRLWMKVITLLSSALPIPSFGIWGPDVLVASDPMTLYEIELASPEPNEDQRKGEAH